MIIRDKIVIFSYLLATVWSFNQGVKTQILYMFACCIAGAGRQGKVPGKSHSQEEGAGERASAAKVIRKVLGES